MLSSERYEIVESIASGDYATVYRGRDHELSRDVAIKQIHQQYLADPRQLDRYWQEAQLLASLQHPHIMTIYDLVRERGWLILELMHGSLSQLLAGRPIDLKDLRLTLNYTLQALQTMHRHGIVHGDIKPSNLLVDRNQRIKLGDFGIARRFAGEGSVVKGTTKYIAPEVVSDQFGPVGQHSDVYSLGFTAYELMCGAHFETLFPGLNMFGRDRQMAWMMWHSAIDRRLPEVSRVLDGVPADLAGIIQKMTEKDPALRYRTTDEVLADLRLDGQPPQVGPTREELEQVEAQGQAQRRRRSLVIAAASCSVILSLGMLFLPPASPPGPQATPAVSRPTSGEVVDLDLERQRIFVKPAQGETQAIPVRPDFDRVFLNGRQVTLDQLNVNDQLQIATSSRDGKDFLMIEATRGLANEILGQVVAVDATAKVLEVKTVQATGEETRRFEVGEHVPVEINGEARRDGKPLGVVDLRPQDQVTVRFRGPENSPAVISVNALRRLSAKGFLVQVNGDQVKLRLADAWEVPEAPEQSWRLAENCTVSLNGQTELNGRVLTPHDLVKQDLLTLEHDVEVHHITALRITEITGTIGTVDSERRTIQVTDEQGQGGIWAITANTQIEIAGSSRSGDFNAFRTGDTVTVHRKSADPADNEAKLVALTPRPDPRHWSIVLEQAEYDNPRLPAVPFASADGTELHTMLRFGYRIPESQFLRERNATRLRLESALTTFLERVPSGAQVSVYCLGLGFVDSQGAAYFAPQGFDETRAEATGVPVRWLIEQLEQCRAGERILVLDTCHDTGQKPPAGFVSAGELAEAARPAPRRPISSTVMVLASCSQGQTGQKLSDRQRGVFNLAVVSAFSGKADRDGNHTVSAQELAPFVSAEVARLLAGDTNQQTPVGVFPDARPPRISSEARAALLQLFDYFLKPPQESAVQAFDKAAILCAGQPDAHLIYALLLIRQDKTPAAMQVLEQVRIAFPDSYVAHQLISWLNFRRGEYKPGVAQLEQMIRRLPQTNDPIDQEYALYAANFGGRMTGFAMHVAPPERRLINADLKSLGSAVNQAPEAVRNTFIESLRAMEQAPRELEQRIEASDNPAEKSRLSLLRVNFNYYVPFDFDIVRQYLRTGLDR